MCTGRMAPPTTPTSTRCVLYVPGLPISFLCPSLSPLSSSFPLSFFLSLCLCLPAANAVAGFASGGGTRGQRHCEANGTQPERHGGGLSPQPPDCHPQLCEWDSLCFAAPLWRVVRLHLPDIPPLAHCFFFSPPCALLTLLFVLFLPVPVLLPPLSFP